MKKTAIAVFFIFKFFSFFALFSHQNAHSKAYFFQKIDCKLLILLIFIKNVKTDFYSSYYSTFWVQSARLTSTL
ncbi:Uncharacterised protein [Haemophilus pittmaniae]|uniref:Uncharacterized protein n=1 Tax=Haemophilus pittmaniae TaxID=249188 RepID=A0A377IVD9_9PAST|nr:Uncharacterised protein [Haemophilus pittmaniae]